MVWTSFSIPMSATCTRGIVVTMRPLPSLVTRQIVPVLTTPKLAPVMPMSARRNSCAQPRARDRRQLARVVGVRNHRRSDITRPTSCRVRCTMGAMMCDGRSRRSWTMYSPRSVSTTSTPSRSSASFRCVSSDTIDLLLTARRVAVLRAMSAMIALASSGVCAQCTCAPLATSFASKRSRYVARFATAFSRAARARSRTASASSSVASASSRREPSWLVARSSAIRS